MSINFACPSCGKAYRLKDELAGKSARCVCGQQIKVPIPPPPAASEPPIVLTDLLDDFEEPTTKAPLNRTPPTMPDLDIEQPTTSVPGFLALTPFGSWLQSTGSALVKIAIGAIVGAVCSVWGLVRDKSMLAMALPMKIAMIGGAAVVGAAAASLLVVADTVRIRVDEGRPVPRILRWYFASSWLSLILWVVTIFAGAILWVFIYAATQ